MHDSETLMAHLDFERFDALTFDCYGTLIDWDTGLLSGLRPICQSGGQRRSDAELIDAYARHEAAIESGPYRRYRDVVAAVLRAVGADFGFEPTDAQAAAFADSVGDWPPFPDSPDALRRLKSRFGLGVITNCDDDLFARSAARLGVEFDWVITAEQARSYKPSHTNFELAFERIGLPRERILHVAQSLYHDHVPAAELGLASVWIDRHGGRASGVARPPAAKPDLTLPDMATFADVAFGRSDVAMG